MTEASPASPPQTAPRTRSRGLHVPTWVATLVVGLIVFGIAFAVGRASGDHGDGRGGFGEHGDRGGFGHHGAGRGIGFVLFLLLIALVITAAVLVVRHFVSRPQAARGAENLLAERFARGEIDEVEYQQRRAALRG